MVLLAPMEFDAPSPFLPPASPLVPIAPSEIVTRGAKAKVAMQLTIADGIPTRQGDERGIIHKKILRTISRVATVIPGVGGTISTIAGALAGKEEQKQQGLAHKFPSTALTLPGPSRFHDPGPCMPPLVRGPSGLCIERTSPLGASRLVGEATMGRYGAALIPGSQIVDRATCLRGMQLGNDGLCYNKGQITNKQRMWPAGRKPLLSGGDMRAISTAARAGRRMELATKRLQRMGMMKKPARARAQHAHAKPVAAVSV